MNESPGNNHEYAARDNPLDSLVAQIQSKRSDLLGAHSHLEAIKLARDEAILLATRPFVQPLNEAMVAAQALEQSIDSLVIARQLKELDLEPMAKTVLDLEMRRRSMTVVDFASGLREIARDVDSPNAYSTKTIMESFRGVENLRGAMEANENPLPIGIIYLAWHEIVDEYDRRSASKSEYIKRCSAFIGTVATSDLRITHEDVGDGNTMFEVLRPATVEVCLGSTKHVRTQEDWGDLVSEVVPASEYDSFILVRGEKSSTNWGFNSEIRWKASEDLDFSLMWRNTYLHQNMRDDESVYVVHGDNVAVAVEKLMSDPDIPHSTKAALAETISSL